MLFILEAVRVCCVCFRQCYNTLPDAMLVGLNTTLVCCIDVHHPPKIVHEDSPRYLFVFSEY